MGDAECGQRRVCEHERCVAVEGSQCAVTPDCDAGMVCDNWMCAIREDHGVCEQPVPLDDLGIHLGFTSARGSAQRARCTSAAGPEVVYRWRPNTDHTYCLSTEGSDFDTVLHVRAEACAERASQVACNDDGGRGSTSKLGLTTEPDTTYYVIVDSYSSREIGRYQLQISEGECL